VLCYDSLHVLLLLVSSAIHVLLLFVYLMLAIVLVIILFHSFDYIKLVFN
jgi:hypothetical protein